MANGGVEMTALKGEQAMALEVGMRGEASLVVGEEQTAAAFGAGGVRVFGTPVMFALMENAAWQLVQP
jgi:predicted thioesterase